MYDIERLLADVRRVHGPLSNRGVDYSQAWDTFNRYVSEAIGKRQTVNVGSFCKIGWRLEENMQGKAKMRPHFHLADGFVRAYRLDTKALPVAHDRALAQIEEFSPSKAALRYSQNLTKENVFMGLRAIVAAIGEACASGQQVCIDFEVGRLSCNERALRFDFLAELYAREGLEAPVDAPKDADYRPSRTFAPASPEAMSALNLSGRSDGFSAPLRAHAANLGGWAESLGADLTQLLGPVPEGAVASPYAASATSSARSHKQRVHNDAHERHVAHICSEAEQAVAQQEAWETSIEQAREKHRQEVQQRRAVHKDLQEALKGQMKDVEQQRAEGRQKLIDMASAHDFPNFAENVEKPIYDDFKEKSKLLKEGLDQQVELKRQARLDRKQQEREMDTNNAEASRKEIAILRLEGAVKREMHRVALTEAWDTEKRLNTIKRAIEDYHRTPNAKGRLVGLVDAAMSGAPSSAASSFAGSGVGKPSDAQSQRPAGGPPGATPPNRSGGVAGGGGGGSMATPRREAPEVRVSIASPRATPRSDAEGFWSGSPGPSRPMTGSVRRVPFGAAASLALHKEKLGATLRR